MSCCSNQKIVQIPTMDTQKYPDDQVVRYQGDENAVRSWLLEREKINSLTKKIFKPIISLPTLYLAYKSHLRFKTSQRKYCQTFSTQTHNVF